MQQWFEAGYFPKNLQIKQIHEDQFVELATYMAWYGGPRFSFVHPVRTANIDPQPRFLPTAAGFDRQTASPLSHGAVRQNVWGLTEDTPARPIDTWNSGWSRTAPVPAPSESRVSQNVLGVSHSDNDRFGRPLLRDDIQPSIFGDTSHRAISNQVPVAIQPPNRNVWNSAARINDTSAQHDTLTPINHAVETDPALSASVKHLGENLKAVSISQGSSTVSSPVEINRTQPLKSSSEVSVTEAENNVQNASKQKKYMEEAETLPQQCVVNPWNTSNSNQSKMLTEIQREEELSKRHLVTKGSELKRAANIVC
jgi:hypothetical protein